MKSILIVKSILIIISAIVLVGCGAGVEIKYVNIPTKCEVEKMPEAPTRSANDLQTLRDNLEYFELMETIARECAVEKEASDE